MKKIDLQFESLVQCTKLSKEQQKKLVNWFARQNTIIQVDIFYEQRNQYFKLKSECNNLKIVPVAAFLLAIQYFYSFDNSKNSKNKQNDLSASNEISKFSIRKAKKERYKQKREKLLNLWSIIVNLRSEAFSFREIAEYLKRKHRLSVSHTYIYNLWKELENGN